MGIKSYELTDEIIVTIGGEFILEKETKFQKVTIMQSEDFGKLLFLDDLPQLCEKEEHIYHEGMVHPAVLAHPNPKKVLVIGGGDGGCVRELLRHPVESIILSDIDKEVIEICREHIPSVSDGAFDDKRVEVLYGDGRGFLEKTDRKFDIIVLDLTDPTGPSCKLFTKEFYEIVKKRLGSGGIMVLDADSTEFGGVFSSLVKTTEAVFPYVYPYTVYIPSFFMNQGFAICSEVDLDKMNDRDFVKKQMDQRKVSLRSLGANDVTNLFTRTKMVKEALKSHCEISTDKNPIEIEK